MNSARFSSCLLAVLIAAPHVVEACSVPVFRYALEHWFPDDYQALVFHRGPLDAARSELINRLRGEPGGARPNLEVKVLDLAAETAAEWVPVWESVGETTLPWMLIRPDPRNGLPWLRISLPLNEQNVTRLLDSPARREISKRIAAGDSVIWLLLESGDDEAVAAAAKRLTERIAYLESVMKLPELSAADIANGLISVGAEGLKLRFSNLRVARDDPEEAVFVRLLLGIESDLAEIKEPMVFPVLGQGRALPPLVGKGIDNAMIDEQAIYLVGSCSCEVKEQNPGVDLLMTADWVGMVKRQAAANPIGSESVPDLSSAKPEAVTFSSAPPVIAAPSEVKGADFDYAVPLVLLVIAIAAFRLKHR